MNVQALLMYIYHFTVLWTYFWLFATRLPALSPAATAAAVKRKHSSASSAGLSSLRLFVYLR